MKSDDPGKRHRADALAAGSVTLDGPLGTTRLLRDVGGEAVGSSVANLASLLSPIPDRPLFRLRMLDLIQFLPPGREVGPLRR